MKWCIRPFTVEDRALADAFCVWIAWPVEKSADLFGLVDCWKVGCPWGCCGVDIFAFR